MSGHVNPIDARKAALFRMRLAWSMATSSPQGFLLICRALWQH